MDQKGFYTNLEKYNCYFFPKQIKKLNILDQIPPDYNIDVTGHSLGAGTAAILAFLLHFHYNKVKGVVFGPPGAIFNKSGHELSINFITSIIFGDDVIPRLGIHSAFKLKQKIKKALTACKLPKYRVLGTCLGCCSKKNPQNNITMEDEEGVFRDEVTNQ